MRAVVQVGYGSADVPESKKIDTPVAADDEVLVRVHAASLGAGDYFGMRGKPFPIRMYIGFPRPKKDHVVGLDLAGRVEAVGVNVTRFKPGDEVFGEGHGACAEFACAPDGKLAHKPRNLTFEQSAALPTSAVTALHAFRDHGKMRPGHKVLMREQKGEGEVWRRALDGHESTTRLVPGVCIDIPLGTAFQYRCTGAAPLAFTCTALPPWPGDDEAMIIDGPWAPRVDPEPEGQRSAQPQG